MEELEENLTKRYEVGGEVPYGHPFTEKERSAVLRTPKLTEFVSTSHTHSSIQAVIPSESTGATHIVTVDNPTDWRMTLISCTCPGFTYHGNCKHVQTAGKVMYDSMMRQTEVTQASLQNAFK